MAKLNYYQHGARGFAKRKYAHSKAQMGACECGYIAGFECAIRSLKNSYCGDNPDVKIWIDTWTNVLTDENEWD